MASNKNIPYLIEFKIKNNINISLLTDAKNYRATLGVPGTCSNMRNEFFGGGIVCVFSDWQWNGKAVWVGRLSVGVCLWPPQELFREQIRQAPSSPGPFTRRFAPPNEWLATMTTSSQHQEHSAPPVRVLFSFRQVVYSCMTKKKKKGFFASFFIKYLKNVSNYFDKKKKKKKNFTKPVFL